ncbi:MAG TPA: ABC transporter permease [Chloroflexi bacterium]|nr:ABC transporter permease [Chloroflexota bacterium]
MLGLVLILCVAFVGVFAPFIAPYDPTKLVDTPLLPPSREYLFGTDQLGRDVFSRIVYGARVSLIVGISAQFLSAAIGVPLGLLAGYYGGRVDHLVMRIVDVFMSFPYILLALMIAAVLGPGLQNVILALGVTGWTTMCRISRVQALSLREGTFVESCRCIGAGDMRIMARHILPNSLAPILVVSTLGIATAITGEASLSFLGMGIKPPEPSWGGILSEAKGYLFQSVTLPVFPGVAIVVAVLGFNLVGDGLRDALDPRLRRRALG